VCRYFLQLSFTGDNYHGWQVQNNARSVQQTLNTALSTILGEPILTTGAGRTDAGVHATEFYAHFNCETSALALQIDKLLYRLNVLLPIDIAIQKIIPVAATAHSRFDALSRTYNYVINRTKDPFQQQRAYYLHGNLDVALMNEAAALLFEYTDFSCFSKSKTQVKTNNCTITAAKWTEQHHNLVFSITANRFLRNMVRAIVGTLIEVGKKQISLAQFKQIIEAKNRSNAGLSVPAHGLYLAKIEYPYL